MGIVFRRFFIFHIFNGMISHEFSFKGELYLLLRICMCTFQKCSSFKGILFLQFQHLWVYTFHTFFLIYDKISLIVTMLQEI